MVLFKLLFKYKITIYTDLYLNFIHPWNIIFIFIIFVIYFVFFILFAKKFNICFFIQIIKYNNIM